MRTLNLPLGYHTITVRATDGLNHEGSDSYYFEIIENDNLPVVGFTGLIDGATYVTGESILITGTADDPVGIKSISYYLDAVNDASLLYSGFSPISLNTAGIPIGGHTVYIKVVNNLDISNNLSDPAAAFKFTVVAPAVGSPPGAPDITNVGYPSGGLITLSGTSVAAQKR